MDIDIFSINEVDAMPSLLHGEDLKPLLDRGCEVLSLSRFADKYNSDLLDTGATWIQFVNLTEEACDLLF